MNARAIKKKLMRSRSRVLWGQRAYLTVRLPLSVLPSQPPSLPFIPEGWKRGYLQGCWEAPDGAESIHINHWTGAVPTWQEGDAPQERPYFVEYDAEDDTHHHWTGHRCVRAGQDEKGRPVYDFFPLDVALIAQQKARVEWERTLWERPVGNGPVIDAMNKVGNCAKSTRWNVEDDCVTVEFGVKWFYPYWKFGFCRALSKALKLARRLGVKAEIVR